MIRLFDGLAIGSPKTGIRRLFCPAVKCSQLALASSIVSPCVVTGKSRQRAMPPPIILEYGANASHSLNLLQTTSQRQ